MRPALPPSDAVDVGVLAGLFGDRTFSHKYLLFLALLDAVERAGARRLALEVTGFLHRGSAIEVE